MAVETRYAASLSSGSISTPSAALGAPDQVWTTDVDNVSWTAVFAMAAPAGNTLDGNQTFVVLARKETGSGTPTLDVTITHPTLGVICTAAAVPLTAGGTGQNVTVNCGTITGVPSDGVTVTLTGTATGGGPAVRSTPQIDGITWTANTSTAATNYNGGSTPALTLAVNAQGTVGKVAGAVLAATLAVTASGGVPTVQHTQGASLAGTFAVQAEGAVGKATGVSPALTLTTQAEGSVRVHGSASLVGTLGVSADGTIPVTQYQQGASLAGALDVDADGTMGRAGTASQALTLATSAEGYVAGSGPLPVAAYSFSEGTGTTVADQTGNGNALTLRETTSTTWDTGKNGGGLTVAGRGSGKGAWDTTFPAITGSAFTLMGWVKRNSNLAATEPAFGFWATDGVEPTTASTNAAFWFERHDFGTSNRLQANLRVNGSLANREHANELTVGDWTHLAMTYDGSAMSLYVNGVLSGTTTVSGTINTGAKFMVGAQSDASYDDIRVYNLTLTQAQIVGAMNTPVGAAPGPEGSASLGATLSTTAAGQVGKVGSASPALTGATNAQGAVGKVAGTNPALTLATNATGVVNRSGGATAALTLGVTASGSVTSVGSGGATLAGVFVVNAQGTVERRAGASLAAVLAATTGGYIQKLGGANPALTLNRTAGGVVGKVAGASPVLTGTVTASGTMQRRAGASLVGTLAVNAQGAVGAQGAGAAYPALTLAVNAQGSVGKATGANQQALTLSTVADGRAGAQGAATAALGAATAAEGLVGAAGAAATALTADIDVEGSVGIIERAEIALTFATVAQGTVYEGRPPGLPNTIVVSVLERGDTIDVRERVSTIEVRERVRAVTIRERQ